MKITEQTIIGDLVASDYRTASVFKKQGIDFCCSGNRTIAEACDKKHVEAAALVQTLEAVTTQNEVSTTDYNAWPLDLLADYVEKKHHRYVKEKIVEIIPYLIKVARVHGERHPELAEVLDLFRGCAEEMTSHMEKEEQILFPFVRNMTEGNFKLASFGTVQNPISMMMNEHTAEGERFRRIATLTNDYTAPEDACNTYRVTYALLKEFEDDLQLHIHLENNILFPKAILMEQNNNTKTTMALI